jgi:hypothetical protein
MAKFLEIGLKNPASTLPGECTQPKQGPKHYKGSTQTATTQLNRHVTRRHRQTENKATDATHLLPHTTSDKRLLISNPSQRIPAKLVEDF